MKAFFSVLMLTSLMLMFAERSNSQIWLVENFNYPDGDSLGAHGWVSFSGGATNVLTATPPGLTFSGYPGSGVGNSVALAASGQDAYTPLSSIDSSGSFYAAAMITVTSAQAGDYVMAFLPSTSTTFYSGRLHVRANGSGIDFGITRGAATDTALAGIWTTTPYALSTTYIVVLKYTFVSGTNNDEISLFVFNSALPTTEPTPTVGPISNYASGDANNLGRIALRQGTASRAPVMRIDGIRVTRSWGSIITSMANQVSNLPSGFRLDQNYPNPFNPSTTLRFAVPENGAASLKVYDNLGREVAALLNGRIDAGSYEVKFDASALSSGLYYARLDFQPLSGNLLTDTRKLILNK